MAGSALLPGTTTPSRSSRHVTQDEPHIFVGDHGANPHMPDGCGHHSGRELMRGRVAAPTIGAESFFAFTRSARSTAAASSAVVAEDGEEGFAAGVPRATRVSFGVAALDVFAELVRSCAITEKVKPVITPRKQSRM